MPGAAGPHHRQPGRPGGVEAAPFYSGIGQAAGRRSGIDRDLFELEGFQEIDDDVRSPLGSGFFDFLCFSHKKRPFYTFQLLLMSEHNAVNETIQVATLAPASRVWCPLLSPDPARRPLYPFGISIPRFTAGRAAIASNQRFTLGNSSSLT